MCTFFMQAPHHSSLLFLEQGSCSTVMMTTMMSMMVIIMAPNSCSSLLHHISFLFCIHRKKITFCICDDEKGKRSEKKYVRWVNFFLWKYGHVGGRHHHRILIRKNTRFVPSSYFCVHCVSSLRNTLIFCLHF